MPNYLVKRLQRVQNCATGYVLGVYANTVHVVNLNWLPILESNEYSISKLTYQGLNDKNWPSYLPVEIVTQKRTLHSNNSGPCVDHGGKNFKIKLDHLNTEMTTETLFMCLWLNLCLNLCIEQSVLLNFQKCLDHLCLHISKTGISNGVIFSLCQLLFLLFCFMVFYLAGF